MFLGEPPQTQYDLHFEIFGFPVRVHPLFWLVSLIMGFMGVHEGINQAAAIFLWVVAVFFSILIHELGHAFAMRYFGQSARVVLYSFGGLAIPDDGPFSSGFGRSRGPREQIIIFAAGPAAGFALAAIVVALTLLLGGGVGIYLHRGVVPLVIAQGIDNAFLHELVRNLLWVNIFWGLMNLLPVYPLDGGQISRELFMVNSSHDGLRQSLWLSVIVAGGIAACSLFLFGAGGGIFIALMFGSLAFSSYQILQQISGRGGGGFGGGRPW